MTTPSGDNDGGIIAPSSPGDLCDQGICGGLRVGRVGEGDGGGVVIFHETPEAVGR